MVGTQTAPIQPTLLDPIDYLVMDSRRCVPPRQYVVVECRHCYHEQWAISPSSTTSVRGVLHILGHVCKRNRKEPSINAK